MTQHFIVVGTDGTEPSLAAVDWAAREAQRRRLPLHIVYAFGWDWRESRFDIGNEYIDVARQLADAVVAHAYDRAREAAPTASIVTDTLIGHAVPGLLEVSHDADLLVLGKRGRGGFTGLLLGSVSQRMASHSTCPVTVVRGHAVADGPVVAGVDDTPDAEQVLATALAAAADRGSRLTVVHSYLPPAPPWLADVLPVAATTHLEQEATDRARLEERLAPWRDKYPDLPVETVLTRESAAFALVEASRSAQLVVVGRGGGGPVSRALLGSTVLQLLHHAECPVLIR